MKYFFIALMCAALPAGACLAEGDLALEDEKSRINYSIGYQVGSDFNDQKVDINPDMVLQGVRDATAGKTPRMTHQEMSATLVDLQKRVIADREEKLKKQAEENLSAGKAFLEENEKKDGVKTLPSGLQYKIISEGKGKTPRSSDTVTVHYKGTLIDGAEFDSSYSRGQPATFRADRVIEGWKEALLLMKEGAKWELFVPSDLAYGSRRAGRIEPNSALIFEVELLSVKQNDQPVEIQP